MVDGRAESRLPRDGRRGSCRAVNLLRAAGNDDAELVITTGKGYRRDGERHRHSWSIVDEAELIEWVLRAMLPGH
jgi:hypothetical protein